MISNEHFVIQKFLENPERMKMGSGKLSKRYKCDREVIVEARKKTREILNNEREAYVPKILIFDIETSPLMAYVWQKEVWGANIVSDRIISEWFVLTWSAKWLFENEIMSDRLTKKEVLDEDDSRIIKEIWNLLNEADIIIAHNARRFDIPNLQTRFLLNNLTPTKPYRQIDTLIVAKREFGFTHNSLDALAQVLGLGKKIDTNFKLWKSCINGDEQALEKMETYNKQDVKLLEDVYLILLPWIKSHPNISLYLESDLSVCTNCGSDKIKDNGFYYTNTSKFQAFKCNECGAISRSRINSYDKTLRKQLLSPIAR